MLPVDTLIWFWGRRGGGPVFALKLAAWIAESQPTERLSLSLSSSNEELDQARATGLPVIVRQDPRLAGSRPAMALNGLRLIGQFRRDLDALKPAHVLIPMNFALAWPLVNLIDRGRSRVTYFVHDGTPHPGDYARLWQETTQRRLIRTADRVVALSTAVADQVLARFPDVEDRLRILPINGLYALPSALTRPPKPDDAPLDLLFVGRLIRYKGLRLLREALEPLKARSDWRLTIAGSGPDENYVREAFADLPQVTLRTEWMTQDDVQGLIKAADVVVCSYVEASQSAIVAEGLAHGKPVIVTPVGALAEQVGFGEVGIVTEGLAPADLSRAISILLDDRARFRALEQRARNYLGEIRRAMRPADVLG